MAVAIEDNPDNDPDPYEPPSYPVLKFISDDGTEETMSDVFPVEVYPITAESQMFGEYFCHVPRVDCTYVDGILEVVVAYRYGCDDYSWLSIQATWDIRVTRMWFEYVWDDGLDEWIWQLAESMQSGQMPDTAMQAQGSGQTHPDIAIDQDSGNIFCAWSYLTSNSSELLYKVHDGTSWTTFPHSLKYNPSPSKPHDPWYVNIDIGLADGLPNVDDGTRVAAFAYTGNFYQSAGTLWGFRPVVGYWDIDDGPDDDVNHPAQYVIIHPDFVPVLFGAKYYAGLPVIDIPADSADTHGVALAFVQDTEDPEVGSYEVYGISSLDYADPYFTHISEPTSGTPEFAHATLPSLAVHSAGDMASVTYFAKDDGDWSVYATLWTLSDVGVAEDPTPVATDALGEFEMDPGDFIFHDWGTASSLVIMDGDVYWAAWSDKLTSSEPIGVRGALGFTE